MNANCFLSILGALLSLSWPCCGVPAWHMPVPTMSLKLGYGG